MTKGTANAIANDFFRKMNPGFWDGAGDVPVPFKERVWTYGLSKEITLRITMEKAEEQRWRHRCELIRNQDHAVTDVQLGSGIDSALNLSDTLMALCEDITRARANFITNEFFNAVNPDYWDGKGEDPIPVNQIWSCKLSEDTRLEISMRKSQKHGWKHYCDVVRMNDHSTIDSLSGQGIDSPLELSDTIFKLCGGE